LRLCDFETPRQPPEGYNLSDKQPLPAAPVYNNLRA
jgi:hypothetical protein